MREEENRRSLFFFLALCARSRALARSLANPPMFSKRTKIKKKNNACVQAMFVRLHHALDWKSER